MKQVRPVTGINLEDFAEELNCAYEELSRFKIEKTERIGDLGMLIHYEIPDSVMEAEPDPDARVDYDIAVEDEPAEESIVIRLSLSGNGERYCCECRNYSWGKGCPYRDGHVRQMDRACGMMNLVIERRP